MNARAGVWPGDENDPMRKPPRRHKRKKKFTEADLVDGIVMEDNEITDNEIITACMRDDRFNHTAEEWLQIIRDWREEYSRVIASIGASLDAMSTT
ncbi:MAG: hypothetical protein WC451_00535 [Patescibacteria group bacterium]